MHRQLARVSIVLLAVIAAAWSALTFPHAATSNSVLFDREIVRILNTHCVMCHMTGGPAEDIVTWQQTWLMRDAIHDKVLARHMPPWAAVAGYGSFKNANQLTLREKRFIVSWVEGLGPRNNGEVFFNVPGAGGTQDEPVTASFEPTVWR
ncbi:MAG: cytochrome c, partial [Gammaproteobacteria bacterium]|nr:cytochrome c [Gammaproteobacteria bacterium]